MTAVEFSAKWDKRFRDNDVFLVSPADLREFKDDLLVVFGLQAVNVPLYSATKVYDQDYLVRWKVAGQSEAFYYSLKPGKLPAPTGATDANWKVVPGPVAAAALSQDLALAAAQSMEGNAVVAGRTYLIDFGPDAAGYAQVVTVLGTAANLFAIRGQLTVNGVRSNVRVNVASGVFGQEVSNLLDTANAWKERQTFLKGLGLYNGYGFDEYAQLSIGQILLADKFLWRGNVQKMAQDVLAGWTPDDYAGQGHGLDAALGRVGAGTVEINTGTRGQLGTLNVLDLFVGSVQNLALNTFSKLAAFVTNLVAVINKKADLDSTSKRLSNSQAPLAEYPLYFENGQYKYDDAKLYLEVQAVGKRVNPLTGKLENDADYTTFAKVKVQPGVTYESVGLGIAYAAYIDVTNTWRQAWTLDSAGASSATASYNSRAYQTPNNGSVVEIYLFLSVRNDDVPYVRIRPTQLYNDQELRRLIAAVSNQTLFNYVPLAASSIDNYITASYFGSLYELSFGPDIASSTNINVWLPIVSTTNVKQSVVVRLLASQTGKTVSVYGRPAATAAGDRVLLQVLKPGDSAGFTVMSAYSSAYVGYGITFSTVLSAASGGGGGGVTAQQLETVRSTVSVATAISGDVTLSLAAAGGLLPVGTASTITVPTNATVAFVVGTVLELVPTTSAMPVVAAASGVTILAATGNKGAGQGCPLRLVQLATDSWLLTGGA